MVVEVLNPQDCLTLPYPMKHPKNYSHSPKPNRTNRTQPNRKKRSPNTSHAPRPIVGSKVLAKSLVMDQVKILKRGEDLKKTVPEISENIERENVDVNLCSTIPDAGFVSTPTPITGFNNNCNSSKVDPAPFYAGSGFISSPSPRSVPMPAFFKKKIGSSKTDDVTSDLKRILRLDL